MILAFPALLLAFLLVASFGKGITNAIIALGIVYVPMLSRLTRSLTMVEKNKTYVEAARSIGFSDIRIIFRHILPNCVPTLIAQLTLDIGYAILDLAAMSFLGLGVQPPTSDWGAICFWHITQMSFTGIDATARYGQTEIADILPVKMLDVDDRVEAPQGIHPVVVASHEITEGLDKEWPYLLGYNKTIMKPEGKLLATIGEDPLIAAGEYGKGRSVVFTSDCSPHWGSPAFVSWDEYDTIWKNILNWLTK